MSNSNDVVVTGVGVCSRLGDDLDAVLQHLRRGTSPPFERWEVAVEAGCGCQLIGHYPGDLSDEALGITRKEGRFMGRAARLGLRAARRALEQSGVGTEQLAVVVGSGTGDVATHVDIQQKLDAGRARRILPTVIPRLMSSTVSANLVHVLQSKGPSLSVAAACAGGAYNLLVGAQMIGSGHAEAALVGGVEVLDPHFFAGFDAMRAFNRSDNDHPERASRPYAADRAGFLFAEGAAMLVLETRGAAEARGAQILGVVLGYGMSSDGTGEMVAPASPGALAAMRRALTHAELEADALDYVNTHATSTPAGDLGEALALRELVGGRAIPYSSTKGLTGHTVSAAGAMEAIFCLEMMRGGWVAPAANAEPLDEALADFPPVLVPEERVLDVVLSNSFGFGGTNASLVLGRA